MGSAERLPILTYNCPSPFLTLGFQLEESMTKEGCVVGSSSLSVPAMLVAL